MDNNEEQCMMVLCESIVTRAALREDAQGFVNELCQLTLTRILRQDSRASLELKA